jgi:hypothetical protein
MTTSTIGVWKFGKWMQRAFLNWAAHRRHLRLCCAVVMALVTTRALNLPWRHEICDVRTMGSSRQSGNRASVSSRHDCFDNLRESQPRNTAVSRSRWRVGRDNWRLLCLVSEQTLAAVAACLHAPPPVSLPRCRGLLLSTILRAGTAEVRERRRRWSTWRTL